jgi:hypothetical protein
MRKESCGVRHIAERQDIQGLLPSASGRIYREQDRPCDQTTHETHEDNHLEESHVEVAIERLVIENELIIYSAEVGDPSKETWFRRRTYFLTIARSDPTIAIKK